MAALISVKRKAKDQPNDVIILTSKRLKTDADGSKKAILFFAGTSNNEVDEYEIYKRRVEDLSFKTRCLNKKRNLERIEKQCQTSEEASQGNKFRLVSHKRKSVEDFDTDIKIYEAINLEESNLAPKKSRLETDKDVITCNGRVLKQLPAEHEECENTYVYDIYFHEGGDFDDTMLNDVFCMYPVEHNYLYEPTSDDESDCCEEDDDSNDEDNWRNDYPDSDGPFHDYVDENDDEDFGMSRLCVGDSDDDSAFQSSRPAIVDDEGSSESDTESAYERYKTRVQDELGIQ